MKIFSVILPVRVSTLLLTELALTFLSFLAGLLFFVQGNALKYLTGDRGWLRILIATISISLGIFVNNLYAKPRVVSRVALAFRLLNVLGIALITQGLLAYVPSDLALPRAVMLAGAVLSFAALFLCRVLYSSVMVSSAGLQQLIFIGSDQASEEIAQRVRERPELGYRVAGYFNTRPGDVSEALGPYLGSAEGLEPVVRSLHRPRIIVATDTRGERMPLASLSHLARTGVPVEETAGAYETICGRVCSGQLRPYHIIFFNELPAKPGSVALQSIYTNLLALSAIILTSPILLLCALAVKLTSRGPLLDRDERVGLHGIPFSLHCFRCYRLDRNAETEEQLLTPAGRVLQALHLVNLPRLFNLLRGEITLVGPRPEKPEFARELGRYFAFYEQRHSIKPGMTGWSQINTRSENTETDSLRELEYDLYYTKHISLALDGYILLHGLRAMLPFARQET